MDSGDSVGKSPAYSRKQYAQQAKKYPAPGIALNHETVKSTATNVAPDAVRQLLDAGYNLVNMGQCLGVAAYDQVGGHEERNVSRTCSEQVACAEHTRALSTGQLEVLIPKLSASSRFLLSQQPAWQLFATSFALASQIATPRRVAEDALHACCTLHNPDFVLSLCVCLNVCTSASSHRDDLKTTKH